MDDPPVVGKVNRWNRNDIETCCPNLADGSCSNSSRRFTQTGPGSEHSPEIRGRLRRCSSNQDGNTGRDKVRLLWFQSKVLLIASTYAMTIHNVFPTAKHRASPETKNISYAQRIPLKSASCRFGIDRRLTDVHGHVIKELLA
jgi:hypothetical protein